MSDLTTWIAQTFVPSRRGQRRVHEGAFWLKHVAEEQLGRYVSEQEFKDAMVAAGHQPINARESPWQFRVALRPGLRMEGL